MSSSFRSLASPQPRAASAIDNDVGLVIGGTERRTGVLNVILGSVASRILAVVPCDVLILAAPAEP
ncbi:universal stress protein [Pararhizobium sp.]|uniref:universal stress protein n=1 Tax=Pararhizobium sp. TaxID=1977563 RepID=UPI0039C9D897